MTVRGRQAPRYRLRLGRKGYKWGRSLRPRLTLAPGPGSGLTPAPPQVYLAAGTVYGLEGQLSELEGAARRIHGGTDDAALAELEDQVATAAAQVHHAELQVRAAPTRGRGAPRLPPSRGPPSSLARPGPPGVPPALPPNTTALITYRRSL